MCESKHQLCRFLNAGSHRAKILILLPKIFLIICHEENVSDLSDMSSSLAKKESINSMAFTR